MTTRSAKVRVNEVSVTFESRGHAVLALDRISLEVAAGEFLCLVGPSGSGKSTLLRVVAGLLRQSAGEVRIEADRPATPLTAMVFQEHALLLLRQRIDHLDLHTHPGPYRAVARLTKTSTKVFAI